MMEIRKLERCHLDMIKARFKSVFMNEPWNDDWSDEEQLHNYILDLAGNSNSLSLGLYDGEDLVGVSLGHIMHWCTGTEYYIQEFFIVTEHQRKGLGTLFLREIEAYAKARRIHQIFLQTERNVPAYVFYTKAGFKELEGHVSLVKRLE